jgi:hypothetical protein
MRLRDNEGPLCSLILATDEGPVLGRSLPIASIKSRLFRLLSVICLTLSSYSKDSDSVERKLETLEARYPVAIRDLTSSRI